MTQVAYAICWNLCTMLQVLLVLQLAAVDLAKTEISFELLSVNSRCKPLLSISGSQEQSYLFNL